MKHNEKTDDGATRSPSAFGAHVSNQQSSHTPNNHAPNIPHKFPYTVEKTVMADFGQTDFGQPFWRQSLAKPTLATVGVLVVWPTLAKTDFGQNRLWPKRV